MRATAGCPIERALLVLDGKWSTLIIRELLTGPKRFSELRTALGMGSPKTLTERSVEKVIHSIFLKLDLRWETTVHKRVKAVVLYLAESS